MQYTDNLGLRLPEGTDFYNVEDMNYNSALIDAAIPSGGIPEGGTTGQVLVKLSNSDYDVGWGNATGGGVGTVVNLVTTTPSFHNKTVTLTGTYATYTATFDNTGHASVNVYYVGTYDIACEGFHNSVNVTAMGLVLTQGIDEDYCTVNITTSIADLEGETIDIYYGTDPTDIRAQLTFDSTLALSFRATQIGDYNIAWASASTPQTFTVSTLSGSMSVTYTPVPIGASATPVNDIQTWLKCGAIFDKNYTTISQVLSDTTTLQTLISSQNANDYLVRSTSWVSNVCGNSTAMSYIGLNNYSANTLLADSTWLNGIANSAYIESVMNVKVPTMTSNTTPSGECFAHSENHYGGDYGAWRAFDGIDSTNEAPGYQSVDSPVDTDKYVGYHFTSSVKIKICKIVNTANTAYRTTTLSFTIQGSNNGSSYTNLGSGSLATTDNYKITTLNNDSSYPYYRYYFGTSCNFNNSVYIGAIYFYGRADV